MEFDDFCFVLADEDDNDYQPSRNRRSRGVPAKQARPSISQETQNVAAFPQPPKERPDAKNHLKVTTKTNKTENAQQFSPRKSTRTRKRKIIF